MKAKLKCLAMLWGKTTLQYIYGGGVEISWRSPEQKSLREMQHKCFLE